MPAEESTTSGVSTPVHAGNQRTTGRLEAEFFVEGDSAFVVDVNFEREFAASTVTCSGSGPVDQFLGQTSTAIGLANENVADDEPVGAVEDARGLVDVGRNEPGEITVGVGEVVRVVRPVDGDPRPVALRFVAVESILQFLRHDVDVLGEREAVDDSFEFAVVGQPKVLDKATDSSLVGGESKDVHTLS